MRTFTLEREQRFPGPPDRIFDFFGDAANLERITPPSLGFRIVTPQPISMREGTLIDYRLRLHGIPFGWRTLIERWNPPHDFVDRQLRGPYRLWVHTHRFTPVDGGTHVHDHVEYAVPFGSCVDRMFVRRELDRIFDYRCEQLTEILGAC
ncbi:MAG: SRPBCC family protein [Planctomycetes bacterium]|nr:SRPBCC family protein [Planctomycetota bacterium]